MFPIAKTPLGESLEAAADGLADGVLHRELEAARHLLVGLHAELSHLLDRPLPDVVLLLAAPAEQPRR